MPDMLRRLGFFSSANGGAANDKSGAAQRPRKGAAAMLRQAIPLGVRQAITRCMPRSLHYRLSMKWVNADIDWARSSVFCIPNANEGYFRVNLAGREPQGIIAPGAYDELVGELESRLAELVVPGSGTAAADGIFRADRVFPGAELRHLPDVAVTWNPDAHVLGELESQACGVIQGAANYEVAPYYTGNHRPNAFVVARGPRLSPGTTLAEGHIVDIPATIFALLGVDPPTHFEGRAWTALLGS